MMKLRSMTVVVALGAALAVPAFAQTTTNGGPASTPAATTTPALGTTPSGNAGATAPNSAMAPSTMSATPGNAGNSTYMTGNNDVRASKVIGASVYNDHDQKIGTVDELLMDGSHDVKKVVLSVGGFLGIDSKLVAVNIDQLQVKPDRIVMAGATKDDLNKMPTFKYNSAS